MFGVFLVAIVPKKKCLPSVLFPAILNPFPPPPPSRPCLVAIAVAVAVRGVLRYRLTQLLVTRIQHELVPMKADVETALAR